MTTAIDAYDLFAACSSVRTFLDALTNWYVRRSRERFWAGDQHALDMLHTVLAVLCRIAAPLLPLTTEAIYRDLTGERSVHLTDWPTAADARRSPQLVATMDRVRDVCSASSAVRKAPAAGSACRWQRDCRGTGRRSLEPFRASSPTSSTSKTSCCRPISTRSEISS